MGTFKYNRNPETKPPKGVMEQNPPS
jgi:hypothetical protein